MRVSINYPWGTHQVSNTKSISSPGWDFGGPPFGWGVPLPNGELGPYWKLHLPDDLRLFDRIGMKAVRFAILFNGLMYGVNNQIPSAPTATTSPRWEFRPIPLTGRFLDDFRELVITFGNFCERPGIPRLTLMPVIFGFEFVEDPYMTKPERIPDPNNPIGNDYADFYAPQPPRSDVVRYSAGRRGMALSRTRMTRLSRNRRTSNILNSNQLAGNEDVSYGQLFLFEVMERLLQEFEPRGSLANYRSVIHSWDLCGEPEGFTLRPTETNFDARHPVPNSDTYAYLHDGIQLVQSYGSTATVGFRYMSTRTNWGWRLPHHLEQFHTYDGEHLPRVQPGMPALIGEAAANANSPFDPAISLGHPELRRPTLLDRLHWFECKNYQEVFLWSAGHSPPDPPPQERHSWTQNEQDQIAEFNMHRGRRPPRFNCPDD